MARPALIAVVAAVLAATVQAQVSEQCHLVAERGAPKPSLTQCYRHNTDACCVSAHDDLIAETYKSLFSAACEREYAHLESFHCMGCDPYQASYTNESAKIVYVCETFANKLFSDDLDANYDSCGMIVNGRVFLPKSEPSILNADNPDEAFLNYFDEETETYPIRPKFFEDYQFVVVADPPNADDHTCFTAAAGVLQVARFALLFSVALLVALLL